MKATENLIKAVGVALEITGSEMSFEAQQFITNELAKYPEAQALAALWRSTREVKGKLTLAEIISRLQDGRPGVEEAWAMIPKDEASSVVWTTDMRDAYAVARPLIVHGDLVAARVAFNEKYKGIVQLARDARQPVEWETSLGTDKDGRELVLLDAAQKGRISVQAAQSFLPYHRDDEGLSARFLAIAGHNVPRLKDDSVPPPAGWVALGEKLRLPAKIGKAA